MNFDIGKIVGSSEGTKRHRAPCACKGNYFIVENTPLLSPLTGCEGTKALCVAETKAVPLPLEGHKGS